MMGSDTRYAILGLLARKPSHGYELATRFNALFAPGREINKGHVYELLQTLRRMGWAECPPTHQEGRETKIHRITQAGDRALTEWHATQCTGMQPQREALYLKLALARQQDAPHLLENIAHQEQTCIDLLRRYTKDIQPVPEAADEWETLARETINEAMTVRLHGDLDWLSKARKRIERLLERLQALGLVREQGLGPNGSAA
jgi:DNA-binding PadR family transcriptional regulator